MIDFIDYYFLNVLNYFRYLDKMTADFVFVDEAAQAKEPETCIAMGFLLPGSQLVLAGDHKQLGPICGSSQAEKYGLGVSLLERLMNTNDLYTNHDPNYVTMLIQNFRSHPDILNIPNELFYHGKLEVRNLFTMTFFLSFYLSTIIKLTFLL